MRHSRENLRQKRTRFASWQGLISARTATAVTGLLQKALGDVLTRMDSPIPASSITDMRHNYAELLPKSVRVQTALMSSKKSKASVRAAEIGLTECLTSASFKAFAEALSGQKLRPRWGTQVLCYGHQDYTGPHNDHHPEDPVALLGYTDLHVTFCQNDVAHQFLVYEKDGHFTQMESVATKGGITCYRLPFWHYTTPLWAKRGRESSARRWVLLGTFLDAPGVR